MEIDDPQLDEFLTRVREEGLEPVSIDPYAGDHGIFALETTLTINGETFTGEVDYEVKNDRIGWYFLEVYLDPDDDRRNILDESSADLIDTTGELLYEYKPAEEEIEDDLETLRKVYSEVY